VNSFARTFRACSRCLSKAWRICFFSSIFLCVWSILPEVDARGNVSKGKDEFEGQWRILKQLEAKAEN
jgi:hypothetical protein